MPQWDDRNTSNTYNPQTTHANGNGHANNMTAEDTETQIQAAFENARAELDRYMETAAGFIRERPVVCIAGAVAIGYLVGKLASRK